MLAITSAVALHRGLAEARGELPVWGRLTVITAAAAMLLLANVQDERRERS